jgi:hypothetical protein
MMQAVFSEVIGMKWEVHPNLETGSCDVVYSDSLPVCGNAQLDW